MQKLYSLDAINKLIDVYVNQFSGELHELKEGTLGFGLIVLTAPNRKSAVIKEQYLNEWSSAHTVTLYNKLPKKFAI